MLILIQTLFRIASIYIFSYISPDKTLKYLSKSSYYSLTRLIFVNIVIIVPILEELFYIVIMLNRLKGSSVRKRLIISSIIFGIVHLEWFIIATLIGYILGYAYLKTRSLIVPIILHSVVNLIAFIAMYLESEPLNSVELIRSEGFYPFLISLFLSPLYIYLFRKFWLDIKNINEVPYIKNMTKETSK